MSYPIDMLQSAAQHARQVATLIDAARVLTFTAQAKSRERLVQPDACSIAQIDSLLATAGATTLHARQMAADTRRLLGPLEAGAMDEPLPEDLDELTLELDSMRLVLAHSIEDALRALDLLETVQELGERSLHSAEGEEGLSEDDERTMAQLFERLRSSGPAG